MSRRTKGFTLIELLAVIAIIGILAALAAVSIANATRRARDAQRQRDLSNIKTSLELFAQDNGAYPETIAELVPTYIKTLPKDPRPSQSYVYTPGDELTGGTDNNDYIVQATLENQNAKRTLDTSISCDNTDNMALKGNGVATGGTIKTCFRVSND